MMEPFEFSCGCVWNVKKENGAVISIDYNPDQAPLDCPRAWDILSKGLTAGIFQLETGLGSSMSQKCKPRNIEELSHVLSIIRPGVRDADLDGKTLTNHYVHRKFGKEKAVPMVPALEKITEDTQHILVFQEQVMKAAQVLAGFSGADARALQKAMTKKKPEVMAQIKVKFIEGCINHSGFSNTQAEELFDIIEANQRYSFNKCLSGDSLLTLEDDEYVTIRDCQPGQRIKTIDGYTTIISKYANGEKEVYDVLTEWGYRLICTIDHKFLCEDGQMRPLREVWDQQHRIVTRDGVECIWKLQKVMFPEVTYDIEVDSAMHVYFANGIAVSNSHAVAYALDSYLYSIYPKAHFTKAFFVAQLEFSDGADKYDKIFSFITEAKAFNINVVKPDLRMKNLQFIISGSNILYSLSHIKHVSRARLENLLDAIKDIDLNQTPYLSLLLNYLIPNLDSRSIESLIKSGALDFYNLDRLYMLHIVDIYRKLTPSQQAYCTTNSAEGRGGLLEMMNEMYRLGSGKLCPCKNIKSVTKLVDLINLFQNPGESLVDNYKIKCKQEKETTGYCFSLNLAGLVQGSHTTCATYKKDMHINLPCQIFTVKKLEKSTMIDVVDETGCVKGIFLNNDVADKYGLCLHPNNNVILQGSRSKTWENVHIRSIAQL